MNSPIFMYMLYMARRQTEHDRVRYYYMDECGNAAELPCAQNMPSNVRTILSQHIVNSLFSVHVAVPSINAGNMPITQPTAEEAAALFGLPALGVPVDAVPMAVHVKAQPVWPAVLTGALCVFTGAMLTSVSVLLMRGGNSS